MNQAMWTAKTGVEAQQVRMQVISNNLANVNTTGFKKSRANFEDLLYQNVRQVGGQSSQDTQLPSGLNIGTGVRTVSTEKMFTQGNQIKTDKSLDMAIQGQGFFQILMPDGTLAYTRNGSFQLNSSGQIVTSSGFTLQPAITVPANAQSVTIGRDGVVSVTTPGNATPTNVGNVQLSNFVNRGGLQAIGENLFRESSASGSPQTGTPGLTGLGSIGQGFLESSNVNIVEELVNMIEAQRAYEMNSKAIQTSDSMMQFATQTL
ncbi:Flagellar basal-body rod protein FlgG [hydrothermal vent metagenome]|uniref:Flagellar basal-body rod protein FlgG n=1 Tax=hydrothermal vent metagenome TaxID=652676 RepID=A0A3B0Y005_9ZZZZ